MNKTIIILGLVVIILGLVAVFNYGGLVNKEPIVQNNAIINKEDNTIQNKDVKRDGPSIEVDQKSYDFGIVKYGDVAKHIFKITNAGTENLEILKLSTSCGCTKASVADEDKIILPGKTVDMIVTFDPAVHKDDTDLGELQRIVYIRTNDPNNNEAEIEIRANVVK